MSRYDSITGKYIEIKDRIGLLDRKLRVLNENYKNYAKVNNKDEKEVWISFAYLALKHTYGYEWRGDNLLLGRENILFTIIDYYKEQFGKESELNILKNVAYIISWNIWQMDGFKFIVPMSETDKLKSSKADFNIIAEDSKKLENGQTNVNGIYCKIKNWDLEKDKNIIYFAQCVDLKRNG